MKTFATIIFVLLVLSLAGNWIQYDSGRNQENFRYAENLAFQNAIEAAKARADSASRDAYREREMRRKSQDSAKVAQRPIELRLRASLDTVASLKKQLAVRLEQNPDIAQLVTAQDLAYARLDSLYNSNKLRHGADIVSYEAELADRGRQLMAEVTQKELWKQTAQDAQSDANREKRKAKVWRNVAYGLGVLAVILSLK